MDSKVVSSAIKKYVHPFLKKNGFTEFTSRSAWRRTDDRIEVLNFQSFNAYKADIMGTTTYSFGVNLGSYLRCVPQDYPLKCKDGKLMPEEYHCHFRSQLARSFSQPELSRDDIWFIDPNGKYLETAFDDVVAQLPTAAFPWFESLRSDKDVLRVLLNEQETMFGLWGFGNFGSPKRELLTGFVALHVGELELARERLSAAATHEPFRELTIEPLEVLAATTRRG